MQRARWANCISRAQRAWCRARLTWLPALQIFEGRLIEGDLKSGGNVLSASSGTGASRQTYNYSTDRVVGNGSFGVVFQATCLETGETVGVGLRKFSSRMSACGLTFATLA